MEKDICETKMKTKIIRPVNMILLKIETGKEKICLIFLPTGFFDDGFFSAFGKGILQNLNLLDTLPYRKEKNRSLNVTSYILL